MMLDNDRQLFEHLADYLAVLKANREAAVEAAQCETEALDKLLKYLYQNAVMDYDVNKIHWTTVEGPKGPYERASEQSLEFGLLLKDLEDHGGRLNRNNYFYWKFSQVKVIGRKKR